jgi:hypothetical protein
MAWARGGGEMKGKIDKDGYLWKEVPGGEMVSCMCVNSACLQAKDYYCNHSCVAFGGPFPEKECAQVYGDGSICPGRCEKCEMFRPTGRAEIHYCEGVLRFGEFADERVK